MKKLPSGVFSVLLTPLSDDGSTNENGFRFAVEQLVAKGVHGAVVLGSTGELPYLTLDEKKQAIDIVMEAAAGRLTIFAGAGAFGTDETLQIAKHAAQRGAAALLVPLPIYFKLTFEGIREHFKRIAGETSAPIIYYHFPETTHLDLSADEIAKLFEIENMAGIKESTFNLNAIRRHMRALPKDAAVYSGTILMMRAVMRLGGDGCICPVPNVAPEWSVRLHEAIVAGDSRQRDAMERKLFQLLPLFAEALLPTDVLQYVVRAASELGLPMKMGGAAHAPLKEALRLLGHPITAAVKSPLPSLSSADRKRVRETLLRAGLITRES